MTIVSPLLQPPFPPPPSPSPSSSPSTSPTLPPQKAEKADEPLSPSALLAMAHRSSLSLLVHLASELRYPFTVVDVAISYYRTFHQLRLVERPLKLVALASLFLASKVDNVPRKASDIVRAFLSNKEVKQIDLHSELLLGEVEQENGDSNLLEKEASQNGPAESGKSGTSVNEPLQNEREKEKEKKEKGKGKGESSDTEVPDVFNSPPSPPSPAAPFAEETEAEKRCDLQTPLEQKLRTCILSMESELLYVCDFQFEFVSARHLIAKLITQLTWRAFQAGSVLSKIIADSVESRALDLFRLSMSLLDASQVECAFSKFNPDEIALACISEAAVALNIQLDAIVRFIGFPNSGCWYSAFTSQHKQVEVCQEIFRVLSESDALLSQFQVKHNNNHNQASSNLSSLTTAESTGLTQTAEMDLIKMWAAQTVFESLLLARNDELEVEKMEMSKKHLAEQREAARVAAAKALTQNARSFKSSNGKIQASKTSSRKDHSIQNYPRDGPRKSKEWSTDVSMQRNNRDRERGSARLLSSPNSRSLPSSSMRDARNDERHMLPDEWRDVTDDRHREHDNRPPYSHGAHPSSHPHSFQQGPRFLDPTHPPPNMPQLRPHSYVDQLNTSTSHHGQPHSRHAPSPYPPPSSHPHPSSQWQRTGANSAQVPLSQGQPPSRVYSSAAPPSHHSDHQKPVPPNAHPLPLPSQKYPSSDFPRSSRSLYVASSTRSISRSRSRSPPSRKQYLDERRPVYDDRRSLSRSREPRVKSKDRSSSYRKRDRSRSRSSDRETKHRRRRH